MIDEPPSTRVWQQGSNGEVRVGARLEKLLDGLPLFGQIQSELHLADDD